MTNTAEPYVRPNPDTPKAAYPHGHDLPFVHHLFDSRAARQPRSAAVSAAGIQLNYGQLAGAANQLAHRLRALGVGPEAITGVCLERGRDAICGLLAVWKAGGAYLPLDPSLPAARLIQLGQESRPDVILTTRAHAPVFSDAAFSGTAARLVLIDSEAPEPATQPGTAPDVRLHPDNLAYALCTSGSTGHPKTVAVSHRSLTCVGAELVRAYQISPRDRVLQLAPLGVDTSIEQILVALLGGATVMQPDAGTVAPADLLGYLAREQVTVVDLTPAYWHQLLAVTEPDDERLRSVRLMITGGERANPADGRTALRAMPGARWLDAYGLTETTITSTLAGQPVRHAQVLVLDPDLNQLPAGAAGSPGTAGSPGSPGSPGEIYLGGCGVARGYLGRPALTAARFLPNPHDEVPGRRMYRSGDLGRWRADRQLEVIGRIDRQLQIRGFRVEPAEIEAVLARHPGITAAAVIAYDTGPAQRQLAAYYTHRRPDGGSGSAGTRAPDPAFTSGTSLRSFLTERLPGYMVPVVYIALDRLPLTPAGNVDRDALPPPAPATAGRASPADGWTPVQAGMSHLWSQLLGTGRIGLDDDFFQLGGNSLLAAEMLAHARVMFGIGPEQVRPLTRALLRDPTLRGFSDATRDARAGRLATGGADPGIDFTREAALTDPIRLAAGPVPDWRRPREILLTGSTGFFGAHLLRELLAGTSARVHCLVRARSPEHGQQRIARAAARYELGTLPLDRVVPVIGNLAEPGLGLSPGAVSELARTIDVIHHAGATVNFIYPYRELRAANVTGTRELIRLAGLYRGIPVHYVSTTTVLAGFGARGVREVTEDTPLAYAEHLGMGYIETKFVAEELLRNAARAGLPVAIYRPLDIVGDPVWNTATELSALIRFITEVGLAPDIDLPLDFVPAGICAAAIRCISTRAEAADGTYHLASPAYALLASLVDRLRQHGYDVTTIPYPAWVDALLEHAARHPSHPMTPFVPLFVDRVAGSGLTVAEMYLEHVFPAYTRSRTEQALAGSGIAFPPVDAHLLDLAIGALRAQGYLSHPGDLAARRAG